MLGHGMARFMLLLALALVVASAWLVPATVGDPQTSLLNLVCNRYSATPALGLSPVMNSSFTDLRANLTAGAGFATSTYGDYSMAQCRPYVAGEDCVTCFDTAVARLSATCGAAIGGRAILDGCMMRYELSDFFLYQATAPGNTQICNGSAVDFVGGFERAARALITDLAAAVPDTPGLAAAAASGGVYAAAQCVETIRQGGCAQCLTVAVRNIDECLPKSDGRAVDVGCFMRYSDKPFFPANATVDLAAYLRSDQKTNFLKILLPTIACLLLLTLGALVWKCKSRGKWHKKKVQKRTMLVEYFSSTDEAERKNIDLPFISFESIVTATDNFSDYNMLGKGGFGKVYKGTLEGTKEVAIKRLSKGSGQGTKEFRNEVLLIAKLQHKNLVKLLGCCVHEDEKLLVYEYLPNKSLDYFLFDSARKSMLQWSTRFKIIHGVARGIMYLHQDSRLTIIHRDLKASNILLDKDMSPKISDFGMARIFSGDELQANTNRVVGTYGYMSPEYAMEGAFSVKSDTYSYGILMLEIVSGLKISSPHLIMDFTNLRAYAWNKWKEGKIEDLVDSSVMENCSLDEVSRCIHIGLVCVQDDPSCRPLMSVVVSMLENKTTPLPTPNQPTYFALRDSYQPGKAVDKKELSINDISLTVLEGR